MRNSASHTWHVRRTTFGPLACDRGGGASHGAKAAGSTVGGRVGGALDVREVEGVAVGARRIGGTRAGCGSGCITGSGGGADAGAPMLRCVPHAAHWTVSPSPRASNVVSHCEHVT